MKKIIYTDTTICISDYFKDSVVIDSNSNFSTTMLLYKDDEDVSLGFLIDGNKKGFREETSSFVYKSLSEYSDFYFSYFWICSVGKYARFNACAMERFASYFGINASLTMSLASEKEMMKCCKKVESGAIQIPFISFFAKLHAKKLYKKFN